MISRSEGASDFGHRVNRRAHKAHRDIRGAPLSMFAVLKSRGLESTVSPLRLNTSRLLKTLPALLHRGWVVLFRPWLGSNCRFHPVCSDYAREAVERLGWIRGGALAIGRICRCHPYCKGGFDPVPNR